MLRIVLASLAMWVLVISAQAFAADNNKSPAETLMPVNAKYSGNQSPGSSRPTVRVYACGFDVVRRNGAEFTGEGWFKDPKNGDRGLIVGTIDADGMITAKLKKMVKGTAIPGAFDREWIGKVTETTLQFRIKHTDGTVTHMDMTLDGADARPPDRKAEAKPRPPLRKAELDKELLINPGCEDALVAGKIPGWNEVRGAWQPQANFGAKEGRMYFCPEPNAVAELEQDVSLATLAKTVDDGVLELTFSGAVQSYKPKKGKGDAARIIIEFRNAANDRAIDRFDSGEITHFNAWRVVPHHSIAPKETRFIRVRLIATRNQGDQNDGWFDDLSLKASLKK